jgi:hypothetical protein
MALGLGEQVGYSNLVEACSARPSTRARASPTGRAGRSTSARSIMRSATSPISPSSSPRCSSGCARPAAAPGSTRRWSGSPTRPIISTIRRWPGSGQDPSRKPDVLGRLKALAAWRELEARSKNLPRGRIMKDETLADVAVHPPASQEALARSAASRRLEGQRYRRADDGGAGQRRAAAGRRAAAARGSRPGPRPRRARWSPTCSSCCSRSGRARAMSRRG